MEVVKEKSDISKLVDNQIYGDIELNNAQIEWKGTGNVLYCVGKIQLENCKIRFTGNHSLIYFDENLYPFSINIRVGNDSVFYLGKGCFLNKTSLKVSKLISSLSINSCSLVMGFSLF